jgi:hypothetical protein
MLNQAFTRTIHGRQNTESRDAAPRPRLPRIECPLRARWQPRAAYAAVQPPRRVDRRLVPAGRVEPRAVRAGEPCHDPAGPRHADTCRGKRIEQWIRFGHDVAEQILDRRRVLSFASGSIFAYVRWAATTSAPSSRGSTPCALSCPAKPSRPCRMSGRAAGFSSLSGWPKVERVLQAIDSGEQLGVDPADACPDHWRQLHNRLALGEPPRAYTTDRHRAWLLRRSIDT